MKRVLLTGMSGTGKSTLITALGARGYRAVDLDSDEWSEWVAFDPADPFELPACSGSERQKEDWVWREDRLERLLSTEDVDVLFVGGTASNQGKFRAHFDHIILLSAPPNVVIARLSSRTTNSYGKSPDELARVLHHLQTVEPLLRRAATLEVTTDTSLDQILETIEAAVKTELDHVRCSRGGL